jgi:hypothetical protein
MGVNFLLLSSGHKPVAPVPASPSQEPRVEALIGLLLVSGTGIVLFLFPVGVITRFLPTKISLSSLDERALQTIRIFGRMLGSLFLIAAVHIVRNLH